VDERYATHLPQRSWCPVCIKACGKEDAHKDTEKGDEPIVSMDCKDFGERPEEDGKVEMIVIRDEATGNLAAYICEQKGLGDTWVTDRLVDYEDSLGHGDIIAKGDREPALVQVQNAINEEEESQYGAAKSSRTYSSSKRCCQSRRPEDYESDWGVEDRLRAEAQYEDHYRVEGPGVDR